MHKTIAYTAFAGGLLLILVPRFILPACEYKGYAAMHCSDTARAEYIIGMLIMLTGAATFYAKTAGLRILGALAALALFAVSWCLPDTFGYCQSPRMPCNYGMVPGIRFIDMTGSLIMLALAVRLGAKHFKKDRHD